MSGDHGAKLSGELEDAERAKAEPGVYTNRLINATSPYLLQHAHNPVDWYSWGEEAIEKARREQKPIFLSIGYSACHWCHVMEREVFEKQDIANIMNEHFVNIKVDREERPDLDELYMLATQLMSGSGGWPMSVWLTPELEPFYAGTYFPPHDAYGRPGFPRLEMAIAEAWRTRRGELYTQAKRVVEAIRMHADESSCNGGGGETAAVDWKNWFAGAVEGFADRFDYEHGGLGAAPKFPPHQGMLLWLAMLRAPNVAQLSPAQVATVQAMAVKTLDGMMRGGIYDQVGGAFARYSTDEKWLVPHFEKMLYDNAQLAPAYALAAVQFGRADYARIARQTLDFWLREMRSSQGAMYSTLDADSEGAEGKYYVWTPAQIREVIANAADADLLLRHLGVMEDGNWHESPVEGGTVLSVVVPVQVLAQEQGTTAEQMQKRIDVLLGHLRAARTKRVPPGLDDKVLTSWNGMMISALALCGRVLREPRYLEAAHRAIGFVLTHHMEGGKRLLRVSRRGGTAHTDAFLEDHAFLLNGLMDLIDSTMPTSLPGTMARKRALELADTLLAEFEDREHGGFFFIAPAHDQLFARMKNAADNATPSANAMAIRALLRLARSSGKEQYREAAMRAVHAFAVNIQRRPDYFPTILQALLEDAEAQAQGTKLGIGEAVLGGALGMMSNAGAAGTRALPIALEERAVRQTPMLSLAPITMPPVVGGGTFEVAVELTVAAGYHVQPHHPADREAFATVARLRGDVTLQAQEWVYPGEEEPYAGTVRFVAKCSLPENVAPGRYTLRATVLAQPCSETACLPPEKVSVDFPLAVMPR